MDPILYGFTLGVLFTTGVALWQKLRSKSKRQKLKPANLKLKRNELFVKIFSL